jgi:FkbM family methyltransferase
MKLAIIDIIGIPYDGTTVFRQGLGGSESAVTLMGLELQRLGFAVTIFNNCDIDHARPGVYEGVTYRPLHDLTLDHEFDVVISSRTVIPFIDPADSERLQDGRAWQFKDMNLYDRILSRAKMRILWMHDTFCLGDIFIEPLALADRITDVFTLSDFHTSYTANCDHGGKRMFEALKRKITITRNGVRNYIPEVDIKAKDPNLFVYNASVTKGMLPLIEHVWPRVKRHIPNAQLKIIGGYYRFSTASEPDEQEKRWRILADDPNNAARGLEFTGVIPQKDIAEILARANFTIYPTAFPETFGISTLESLLYNTPVLTCRFGALEEIALERACYLIDYPIEPNGLFPNVNPQQQVDRFVDMVVGAYNDRYLHQQKQYYCNIVKDIAGWDAVAMQWKQIIFRKTGAYLPAEEYRRASHINHRVHKVWNRRFTNQVEFEDHRANTEQEIVIVSPFYNGQAYIADCILSVASQDYTNYRHILIDDCSSDNVHQVAQQTIDGLPVHIRDRFTLIKNPVNQGAVKNQIDAIRKLNDQAIIMLLDGDDQLVNDNSIFARYNAIYDGSTEFTYGSCWSMVDNIPLISQPYPEEVKQRRDYRNHHFNWILPYTHLRTFKKHLMNNLPDALFQDPQGQWFKAGGDGAVFYALIEAADPNRVKCLQDIVYNYNDANPLNDYKVNAVEQNVNARVISTRPKVKQYSVIVPTMWRRPAEFVAFLAKLCDHPAVDEIIIINNDNTQTPAEIVNHAKIHMFDFGRNIYVNPAWNLGVKTARNDRICIVNDDVGFDLNIFARLEDLLTPDTGVFGLCPGEPDFSQPPVTDGAIDIIPWTGQHTYGFGCLMFLHRDIWQEIPAGLEIYYGDNFIFDLQLKKGRTNYIIANMMFTGTFAATTSNTELTGGFLDREQVVYEQEKLKMNNTDILEYEQRRQDQVLDPVQPIKPVESIIVPAQPVKKRILIGIPTAKYIEVDTFKSIYDMEVPEGYQTEFQYFYGYSIDQIRNLIAHWALHYDYLFSIDSDIAFERDTLKKMLSHDRDMVSGLYIQRKFGTHTLELYEHNGRGGVTNIPYETIKDQGLIEIAGCGFGCVLVKTDVIRAIDYPQFKYHSAIDHAHTISEDTDFCTKALAKGFRIWADTSIKCRHIGSHTFQIDDSIVARVAQDPVKRHLREVSTMSLLPNNHGNYLVHMRQNLKIEPQVVYDIGACVLNWTNHAKRVWSNAEYIAFDAMAACEFLYQEAGVKYNIGLLSDQDGRELGFYENTDYPGGNSYYRENSEFSPAADQLYGESSRRTMTALTLDSVVSIKGFPPPDLIMMDIQGAELDVLHGAKETLKSTTHVILGLQVVEYNKGAPLRDEVILYMHQLGFDCLGIFCNNGPDGDYHFVRR